MNAKEVFRSAVSGVLLSAIYLCAHAGQKSYECTVRQVLQLSETGLLVPSPPSSLWEMGATFNVNRNTGSLASQKLPVPFPQLRVLWRGSAQHFFLAQAESPAPTPHILVLRIDEFREGTAKPFFLYYTTNVVSGTCY